MKLRLVVLAVLAAFADAACSSPDEGARLSADVGLSDGSFGVVSDALVYQCGTLDCHGSKYRNLRLYGFGGLRLGDAGPDNERTRSAVEVRANYEGIVGLEPESFVQVVSEGGREPERLSLVGKARALQNHKGGPVMKPGDPIDDCITSWLRRSVDQARCEAATPFRFR